MVEPDSEIPETCQVHEKRGVQLVQDFLQQQYGLLVYI